MDDLFDFLFTVIAAIFVVMFISAALLGSVDKSNKQSLAGVAEFKLGESALNNVFVQVGEGYNFENYDLSEVLSESEIVGGITITTCLDYKEKTSCESDPAEIMWYVFNAKCGWDEMEKKCIPIQR